MDRFILTDHSNHTSTGATTLETNRTFSTLGGGPRQPTGDKPAKNVDDEQAVVVRMKRSMH